MKVLHVSPLLFGPDGVVGGGERYPLELARAMAPPDRDPPDRVRSARASAASPALPVRVYRPCATWARKASVPVAPQLVAEIARADVVHCHQMHTFLADQCVLLGRLLRKPVFLTDHAGGDRNFNRRLRTWQRATGLLLVSHFNAREFARSWRRKVTVIHGGVDPQRFAAPAQAGRRRRRALYAGRLIPYKGIQYLIEGVAPGDGGAPRRRRLPRGLRRATCGTLAAGTQRALPRPRARRDDLRQEYVAASALVLPSVEVDLYGKRYPKSEILGLVLLEAMACETPVVCSAHRGDAGAGRGRRHRRSSSRPATPAPSAPPSRGCSTIRPLCAAWGGPGGSTSWPASPGGASPSAASAVYRGLTLETR